MSQVQFFAITDAQYAALAVKDPGALYFLTHTCPNNFQNGVIF